MSIADIKNLVDKLEVAFGKKVIESEEKLYIEVGEKMWLEIKVLS